MRYRSDIDGLRALAVVPVVLFHAHVPGVSGGFVGVDIFFVISGFLICSLIADEIDRGEFSLVSFYERRCRRILPALFTMFLVSGAVAGFVLLPPDMESFCRSLLASTFFVSNIHFWQTASYFDGGSEFKPLLHTWSLGVEEQFYIVVPLILIAIARWSRLKYTPWLLALTIGSFALSVWGLTHAPTANFYSLPTRFWELAVGALIALQPLRRESQPLAMAQLLSAGGLGLILYAVFALNDESSFPGWNALFPCLGAAAIIHSGGRSESLVCKLLSTRPAMFIGKISYSLYLWHWPMFALMRYRAMRELTPIESSAAVLAGLLVAVLSWRYVETPFRNGSPRRNVRFTFFGAAVGMVCMTAVGVAGVSSAGFGSRFPNFAEEFISGAERYNEGTCFLTERQRFSSWREDQCLLSRGHPRTVLLWGDSFAAHYAPGIVDEASELSVNFLQYTASACPPVFDYYTATRPYCREFNENLPNIISKYNIKSVVMAGRWESLFKRGVTPEAVAETVKRLHSLGVKTYVIGQSPVFGNNVQIIFASAGYSTGITEARAALSFNRSVNRRLAAALPEGVFIDPLTTLCQADTCDYRRDGQYLVRDIGHLSAYGSRLAVVSFFPFVGTRP